MFHVISASTTTGFQFIDLSQISTNGKVLLIVLMLIGGTAFSTAGGIKIARLLLIFNKLIKNKKYTSIVNGKTQQTFLHLFLQLQFNFVKEINNKILNLIL
jgi:trk system potassium uptake protein TrkH